MAARAALKKERRRRMFAKSLTQAARQTKYTSLPLRLMAAQSAEALPRDAAQAGRLRAPKNFSLQHNPQETLRALFRLAKYAKTARDRLRIYVDLYNVRTMDLAADSLLAILLKEIKNECFGVRKASIRGVFPASDELQKEMEEVGTVRVLLAEQNKDNIEVDFSESAKTFRHRETGVEISRTLDASDSVETVTRKFADHVNGCLLTIGYELNDLGRRNLCDYIGEVLTNAQEHAGIKDWTIVGYLHTDSRKFKVAVINFGKSIEATFAALDEDSYAWKQVKYYVGRHEKKAASAGLSPGTLMAVAALQERVSSKNIDKSGTRGQGTVTMIEFFQRMFEICAANSSGEAEMALISGSAHIIFNGKYKIAPHESTGRSVIAFNPNNSLSVLPDSKVVKTMPGVYFPGTIITIEFPLSESMQIREVER